MASKSELWGQIALVAKILDEAFKFSAVNATNFLGIYEDLTEALEGNHISETISAISSVRSALISACNNSALDALIMELSTVYGGMAPASVSDAIDNIEKCMVALSETIKNRSWTYGSLTTGGANTGNGIAVRITKDKNNATIEAGHYAGGTIKILIDSDKNTGATAGSESFTIFGNGKAQVDAIEYAENTKDFFTTTVKNSATGILQNGNFSAYTGTGLTDISFTGWTVGDATKCDVVTATLFREDSATVKFTDNNSILQYFSDIVGTIDTARPVLLCVRYMRKTSCDGTLTLRLGSKTNTVDVSTKNNDEWNYLLVGDASGYGFYQNFKEDSGGNGARISIALTSRTTGSLYIAECVMIQPDIFDGKYYAVMAGNTDFLKDDYFTFTDTVSNTGRIQTTLARIYGKYLPHTSGTETYADA